MAKIIIGYLASKGSSNQTGKQHQSQTFRTWWLGKRRIHLPRYVNLPKKYIGERIRFKIETKGKDQNAIEKTIQHWNEKNPEGAPHRMIVVSDQYYKSMKSLTKNKIYELHRGSAHI